ncbi:MAG: transcriptional regulator [Acidobacteria bacterium]|nr:transcriptional regulator [Acidobacteriota bacterium]
MNLGTAGRDKQENRPFRTGEWGVEPSRNLLIRGTEEVHLEPRVMDVLVHLAERAGEVVSKEELVERVWKQRYVSDDVLTVAVYTLRKVLGDNPRQPRYIETVPRRGYRWIAPVTESGRAMLEPVLARFKAKRPINSNFHACEARTSGY